MASDANSSLQFKRLLNRLFLLPTLVLILLAALLAYQESRLQKTADWVDHSDIVIARLNALMRLVTDEETGARGFLLNQDRVFLGPYEDARQKIPEMFTALEGLMSDNSQQVARLRELEVAHREWQSLTATRIAGNLSSGDLRTKVLEAKAEMDGIRTRVSEMLQVEVDLRDQRSRRASRSTLAGLTTLLTMALLAAILIALLTRRMVIRLAASYRAVNSDLSSEKEWFQTTLRGIGDAVIACDRDGCILLMNEPAEAISGWTEEKARGRRVEEVLQLVHEDTREPAELPVARVLRDGVVAVLKNHTVAVRPDATETAIEDSCAPIRDSAGVITGAVLVFRDASEKRKQDAQRTAVLKEREAHVRRVIDTLAGFVVLLSPDGTLVDANKAVLEAGGLRAAYVLGKPFDETYWWAYSKAVQEKVRSAIRSAAAGESVRFDLEAQLESRQLATLDFQLVPMRDTTGLITHLVGSATDITQRKKTAAALVTSERQFRELAESIPQLAWIAHPDGSIFWYNRRWYEYTGTTKAQMEGWGWRSVHDQSVLQQVEARWRKCIATGQPFEMVFPLRSASGEFRQFLTRIVPLFDGENRVVRWFGTNTDISSERRAAEQLRASHARFKALAESVPQLVWETDAEGNLVYSNPQLLSYAGLDESRSTSWSWDELAHPEDVADTRLLWAEALREVRTFQQELRLRNHYGAYRWFLARAVPVRNSASQVERWVGGATDIHELRAADEALRITQETLRVSLEASNTGTFRRDGKTGYYLYIGPNLKRLFGLAPDEELGPADDLLRIVHPDDRATVRAAIEQSKLDHRLEVEYRVVHKDGSVHWLYDRAQLVDGPDGQAVFMGACTDITHRKLSEETLRKTENLALAGRLVSSISHEINNPLAAITNLIFLIETAESLEEVQGFAKMAENELNRVTQIVTQTLRFHRVSTGARESEVAQLLDSAVAIFAQQATAAGIVIEQQYDDRTTLYGNDGELRQVFLNLIGNALDATRGVGNKVMIRARPGRSWLTGAPGLRVSVADTGHGMPKETARRIFEQFFSTKGESGTGLGLWITDEIIRKHGGTIRLRSCQGPLKHGTVFLLFLPFSPGAQSRNIAAPTAGQTQS